MIALLVATGILQRWLRHLGSIVEDPFKHTKPLRGLVSYAVVGYFLYQYFLRPLRFEHSEALSQPVETMLPWLIATPLQFDAINLVRLGWYLSPLWLSLAAVGILMNLAPALVQVVGYVEYEGIAGQADSFSAERPSA